MSDLCELRGISLPRTPVNKGKRKGWILGPSPSDHCFGLSALGRLPQACRLLLRLARGLACIFERYASERFGPLLEEALVGFVAFLEDLEDLARELLGGVCLAPHTLGDGVDHLLGYLVIPLAGGYPVLSSYPGAFLGDLGVAFGDPAQVLEIRLGHRGRGHLSTPPSLVVASSSKHIYLPRTGRS